MTTIDIVLMLAIVGAAVWLLYRSLWKKKGCCGGDGGCGGSCNH
jgi:hypothetical protein